MFKKYITALGVILIMLTLLLSPDLCISAAKEGLLLWFNKVLPSLLPFIILINILSQLNIIRAISTVASPITQKLWKLPGSSLVALIMGFISGYPMGAKMIRELLDHEILSDHEAQKTLCFSNNCGPLFIIGTVGTLMLKSSSMGYFLLFIHILSALLLSFVFSSYKCPSTPKLRTASFLPEYSSFKFSTLLNEAVKNAMDTIVYIGGYIIFFSVIARMITNSSIILYMLKQQLITIIPPEILPSFITGLLELSNGISMLSAVNMSALYSLALISFMIGFGGLCVHFQTSYILGHRNFSLTPYIISKFMQGILSFILVFIFYPVFCIPQLKVSLSYEIKWLAVLILLLVLFIYVVKCLNFSVYKKCMSHSKVHYTYPYK